MPKLLSLYLLCLTIMAAVADPVPGRVPKVYNALITSNQNLEPSKAYPVYQPVLHETAYAFPFQPAVFYGDFPLSNGIIPAHAVPPRAPEPSPSTPAPENPPEAPNESTEATDSSPAQTTPEPIASDIPATTPAPPPPPTQSPIPLNEFGLPPQVLPLGRVDPAYHGFTHFSPFTYTYPGFRFYDPYDPFSLGPYSSLGPLYRPLTNGLGQSPPVVVRKEIPDVARSSPIGASPQTPPTEPTDLNLLNYSTKDPAIPNVPPPPLPQGGLKANEGE